MDIIVRNLRCRVKLFAENISHFSIVQDPKVAANDLNHDVDLITSWAHDWRMTFNPDP